MRLVGLSAALLALSLADAARADDPRAVAIAPGPAGLEVALVASGGISLGAYQAGVSYVLARALSDPAIRDVYLPGHRLTVATGASAGNINAFLTAVIACDRAPHTVTATANPFFDAWINVGLDKLTPDDDDPEAHRRLFLRDIGSEEQRAAARAVAAGTEARAQLYGDRDGLLTRAAFNAIEAQLAARLGAARYRPGCRFLAGVTATRARATPLTVEGDFSVPTQRYVVPLALSVGDDGRLAITNHPLPDATLGKRLALPTGAAGTIGAEPLLALIEASSAFPVAFAPVTLAFCDATEARDPSCAVATSSAAFTDGGVFDNVPLGMAIALARGDAGRYLYVDPELRRGALPGGGRARDPAGLERLLGVLGAAFTEARRYELQGIARYWPEQVVPGRFRASTRFYEVWGDQAGSFGAFLHRDLRLYDYWVGTYDGLRMLGELSCGRDADCATRVLVELTKALLPARARLIAADGRAGREVAPASFVLRMAARELQLTGALEARVALCAHAEEPERACGADTPRDDPAWAMLAAVVERESARRRDADRGAPLTEPLGVGELLTRVALAPAVGSEASPPFDRWLARTVDRVIDRALDVEARDRARLGEALDDTLLGRGFSRWLRPARAVAAHVLAPPDDSVLTLGAPGLSGADAVVPKLFHLAPRYVLWDARYGGFHAGWEPQLHLASFLHVPLGGVVATRALDPEGATWVGRLYSGVGLDLGWVVLPRLQLLAFGEQPLAPAGLEARGGLEVALTVAHVLRVAVGAFFFGHRLADAPLETAYVTVGLQEVSALLYGVATAVIGP